MATASPTPMPTYSGSSTGLRKASRFVRRDSPLTSFNASQGHTTVNGTRIGESDDDDDIQPPPMLSALGRSVLAEHGEATSPKVASRPSRTRYNSGNASPSNTPHRPTTTPAAPSQRVKRIGLSGAPVRRGKRTPQSEEDPAHEETHATHDHEAEEELPPSRDQENVMSVLRSKVDSMHMIQPIPNSISKPAEQPRILPVRDAAERALAPKSTNTPHRPAPAPPPKMSVLEAATKAAGASTTKKKSRRANVTVNGKLYNLVERCGKGGSAEVWRVTAENGKTFALKKVRLHGQDPNAVAGYKGEIDLLAKLQDTPRVVRMWDYSIDTEKEVLYVLMELGEGDLGKVLSSKFENSTSVDSAVKNRMLDFTFVRYWWKEMLQCVKSVHEKDIVHSDLKPANFLVVYGSLKLIDFGIAGAIDIENTVNMHRDNHVGTPNFMSPESLQDSSMTANPDYGPIGVGKFMKLGKPSDVWSLGCILYQMVYGQPPFYKFTPAMSKVMAIINPKVIIEFPLYGIGETKVPVELRRTMRACLQRDPSKRPTVKDMLSETNQWIHPENATDLRISESLLDQMIRRVAERFKDRSRPPPTDEEIAQYAPSFYAKIRDHQEES